MYFADSRVDSIGVMQIDCEILNTNLIHLYRSAFSEETLNNSTAYARSEGNHSRSDRGNSEDVHPKKDDDSGTAKKTYQNIKYWEKLRKTTVWFILLYAADTLNSSYDQAYYNFVNSFLTIEFTICALVREFVTYRNILTMK